MPSPRLTRADFKNMRGFRRIQGRFFALSFGTMPARPGVGVACVVSSKIAAKASDRNLIKRRCRAIFRELEPKGRHTAYVIIAKKGSSAASFAEIKADLHNLFERVGSNG